MNPVLRGLLTRASKSPAAFPGQPAMRLERPIAAEVLRCLVIMCDGRAALSAADGDRAVLTCFTDIAHRDPSLVADTLQRLKVDGANPTHGGRLTFIAAALTGPLQDERIVWAGVVRHAELGLTQGKWRAVELRRVLSVIGRSGSYAPSLPAASERFVASRLAFAVPAELGHLAGLLSALPETRGTPLFKTLADRATISISSLTMPQRTIRTLCNAFMRAQFYDAAFMAGVSSNVLAAPPEGPTAAAVFALWGQSGFRPSVATGKECPTADIWSVFWEFFLRLVFFVFVMRCVGYSCRILRLATQTIRSTS